MINFPKQKPGPTIDDKLEAIEKLLTDSTHTALKALKGFQIVKKELKQAKNEFA